ncbi:hypothetical protein BC830DRAFT_1159128 [Chytriomyces sp. MP71]|nr:hypothetical protein BC830DRAFT_1159128 [Chytriomyces sp. MP71]
MGITDWDIVMHTGTHAIGMCHMNLSGMKMSGRTRRTSFHYVLLLELKLVVPIKRAGAVHGMGVGARDDAATERCADSSICGEMSAKDLELLLFGGES